MPDRPRSVEWFKLAEFFLAFLFLPTLVFYSISFFYPALLKVGYYFLVSLFIFQAAMSYIYSFSALRRKPFKALAAARHESVPKTTFIVSAYLPNEVEVIEKTLLNILKNVRRPREGIEVVLAYNTPHMEGVESRLKELAYQWPELILANAYGSRSKSENLNYALEAASGEMIVLLDADHLVASDCLEKAWRWLDEGYDVVQGRCKIRNGGESAIAALVEVEFEAIYSISHFAKSKLFDSALFGGTNGYWRSAVIKSIKFREDRLTEDIDATLRTLLAGKRIVHDRSIISTELAPATLSGLWFQRKRWAQGWFQCSVEYQWRIFTSRYFNLPQKFMWTTLLLWRVFYDIISQFLFPIVFAFWLKQGRVYFPMTAFIYFALIFTFFSGPYEGLVAFKNASQPRAAASRYLYYAFLAFPYTLFKNIIQVVAIRDELLGKREWVISRRAGR